jgi:hypothetical protein
MGGASLVLALERDNAVARCQGKSIFYAATRLCDFDVVCLAVVGKPSARVTPKPSHTNMFAPRFGASSTPLTADFGARIFASKSNSQVFLRLVPRGAPLIFPLVARPQVAKELSLFFDILHGTAGKIESTTNLTELD